MSVQQDHYLRLRTAGYPVEMAVDLSGILPGEAPLFDRAVAKGDLEIPSESPVKEIGQKPQFPAAKPPESTAKEITMADGNVAADQLRLFRDRIVRLEEEKKGIADDIKDVYAEAKGQGYDSKTLREIVKLSKMEPDARSERDALIETYRAALGMLDGTPLGDYGVRAAAQQFERSTKGTAVHMKVGDGDFAPINAAARAQDAAGAAVAAEMSEDELYQKAVAIVVESNKASTSYLQRQLRLGYNSAARLIERMEREGTVSLPDEQGRRGVLQPQAA